VMRVQAHDVTDRVARHEDLVADAAHIDDHMVRASRDYFAADKSDHTRDT
jgi:hypothetical protein